VDDADELDAVAIAKAPREHQAEGAGSLHVVAARVEQLGRRLRTGDGRRDLLKSYIGDKSNRGLSADEVRTLVDDVVSRFFDSSDPIDWSNINGLITDITAPLVSGAPQSLDVSIPCQAIATLPAAGGLVFSTIPPAGRTWLSPSRGPMCGGSLPQ
jgi:hypothetical protein